MLSAIVQNSDSLAVQRGSNVGENLFIKKEQSTVTNAVKPREADLAVRNEVSYVSAPKTIVADGMNRQVQMDISNVQMVSQGLAKINEILGDLTFDVPIDTVAAKIDAVVSELKSSGALIPSNGKNSEAGFELNVKTEKVKLPDISSKGLGVKNAVYASAGGIILVNGNMATTILSGSINANENLRAAIADSAAMSVSAQQANLGALQAKLTRVVRYAGNGASSAEAHHIAAQIKRAPNLITAQAHSSAQSVRRLTK